MTTDTNIEDVRSDYQTKIERPWASPWQLILEKYAVIDQDAVSKHLSRPGMTFACVLLVDMYEAIMSDFDSPTILLEMNGDSLQITVRTPDGHISVYKRLDSIMEEYIFNGAMQFINSLHLEYDSPI